MVLAGSVQSKIEDFIGNRKSTGILSSIEKRQCRVVGKGKAIFDVIELVFGFIFLQNIIKPLLEALVLQEWSVPGNIVEMKVFLQKILMAALTSNPEESWAIHAFTAACLTRFTRKIIVNPKERPIIIITHLIT